jgi:uncharacterized membrane protein
MNLNEFLWELLSVIFVTAVVIVFTLYYQKKFDRDE